METFSDAKGDERCDNCGRKVDACTCCCVDCGDHVAECGCDEGPAYPAVMYDEED